jgi:hypothetical protein
MARRLADLPRAASPSSSGPLFGFAMTNSQPHIRKPTSKQLRYLRNLALSTGGSFAYPKTFEDADRQIRRLRRQKRTPAAERRRETKAVRRAMSERRGDSASVRESEIGGYGSSATWR